MSNEESSIPVLFSTNTQYPLPSQKFMIPVTWRRYQLSQLINKALSLPKPVPFDFLVKGEILRVTLREWCAEKGVAEEETLEVEYIESVLPPERISSVQHDDWVSSISCRLQGYLVTAAYDGQLRFFDRSQKLITCAPLHSAPVTSFCVMSSTSGGDAETYTVASASHDLTAQLTRVSLSPDQPEERVVPLATCHLHTGPVSSICADQSGSRLLTSSWDGLIGLWDTSVPPVDEVPPDRLEAGADRKKRRKVDLEHGAPKRKAPLSVLKSHTARVSKVVFGQGQNGVARAYSCGFDSTIRTWDVENGICTETINAPEKPMLDMDLSSDGQMVMAASTDRTISVYDVRRSTTALSAVVASLPHPATPSCLVAGTRIAHQLVSGGYDGVVRVWDLRSVKSAIASFSAWGGGGKKVLSVDWAGGLVGIGGEGGMEIWRMGDELEVP